MANQSLYVATPLTWLAQISAANANLDGTGTLVTVMTATTALGSRIDRGFVQSIVTTSAGMVRLFMNNTTNMRLFYELPVGAQTPSSTFPAWADNFSFDGGLFVPNGWSIMAGTQIANTFNVFLSGGNF